MAAALRKDPTLEVELEAGSYAEFTVLVEGRKVLSAGPMAALGIVPSLREVREAIERARV